MSIEAVDEYVDKAGHALKEVFSDFVVIGIPIDGNAEPIQVQFGNNKTLSAALRVAEENNNGNRHPKHTRRKSRI